MEDDRADLYSAIVKLKSSIDELNLKKAQEIYGYFDKSKQKELFDLVIHRN